MPDKLFSDTVAIRYCEKFFTKRIFKFATGTRKMPLRYSEPCEAAFDAVDVVKLEIRYFNPGSAAGI